MNIEYKQNTPPSTWTRWVPETSALIGGDFLISGVGFEKRGKLVQELNCQYINI